MRDWRAGYAAARPLGGLFGGLGGYGRPAYGNGGYNTGYGQQGYGQPYGGGSMLAPLLGQFGSGN